MTSKYQHWSDLPGVDQEQHFAPTVHDGREYHGLRFIGRGYAVQLNEGGEPMSDGEWRVYASRVDANLPGYEIAVYLHYPWLEDIAKSRDGLQPAGGMVLDADSAVNAAMTILEASERAHGRDPGPLLEAVRRALAEQCGPGDGHLP